MFAVSQSGDGELKLAVAVGRKVALLRWKHPVVWSTWTVGNIKDVADGFEIIKVSFKLFQLGILVQCDWDRV